MLATLPVAIYLRVELFGNSRASTRMTLIFSRYWSQGVLLAEAGKQPECLTVGGTVSQTDSQQAVRLTHLPSNQLSLSVKLRENYFISFYFFTLPPKSRICLPPWQLFEIFNRKFLTWGNTQVVRKTATELCHVNQPLLLSQLFSLSNQKSG